MWPTIFFLFSLSILISLGVWQIQRLIWKEDLISFYNDQYQNSVIRLDESSVIPKNIEFRNAYYELKNKILKFIKINE